MWILATYSPLRNVKEIRILLILLIRVLMWMATYSPLRNVKEIRILLMQIFICRRSFTGCWHVTFGKKLLNYFLKRSGFAKKNEKLKFSSLSYTTRGV